MNNLIPFHGKSPCEICLAHPHSFSEAETAVQSLKKGHLLLVNLADLPLASAQRISDYLAGCAHSLSGQFTDVGNSVYLISPPRITIQTTLEIATRNNWKWLN